MDHLSEMVAGGYVACVIIFALAGIAFAKSTGQKVYFYFSLHALAIGSLALTFPPIAPFANAVEYWHVTARMTAEGMVLATSGLLMMQLLLPTAPHKVRWAVKLVYPAGLMLALNSFWLALSPITMALDGMIILALLIIMSSTLVICARRGSSEARFILIAFTPLLAVGLVASAMEALMVGSMRYYPEAMLIGFAFELLFVFYNLSLRLRIVVHERDRALADALQARRESETDALTGLPNRRVFEREIANDLSLRFTALAIVDCDRFKEVNDRFGHAAGDAVLRSIARAIADSKVTAMRIGGEEFGLFLSGDDWRETLEQLRCDLPQQVQRDVPEVTKPTTVSIGAMPLNGQMSTAMALHFADEALYCAKQAGRDRVVIQDGCKTKQSAKADTSTFSPNRVKLTTTARSRAA